MKNFVKVLGGMLAFIVLAVVISQIRFRLLRTIIR